MWTNLMYFYYADILKCPPLLAYFFFLENSPNPPKKFFHIVMKFEHFKGLTLNLEVPQ